MCGWRQQELTERDRKQLVKQQQRVGGEGVQSAECRWECRVQQRRVAGGGWDEEGDWRGEKWRAVERGAGQEQGGAGGAGGAGRSNGPRAKGLERAQIGTRNGGHERARAKR